MSDLTSSKRLHAVLHSKWAVLSVLSVGTLSSTLDGGMMNVSYPALARAFGADTSTVLWVTVAYWVTAVGLLLTLGWVGDTFGRRRVYTVGMVIFSLGILMSSASTSIWQVIGARVFQGIGSSMVHSNLNALITATFPTNERGKALGISGAVVGIGLSTGPLLGGMLLDTLGWRALFYTRVPLGILGVALAWWLLPRDHIEPRQLRIDYLGAMALFGAMASLLLAVNQGGRLGFGSLPVRWLLGASAIFLLMLFWGQQRAVRPIMDFVLFRSGGYVMGLLVTATHYLSQGGIMLIAPFFFMDGLRYSATTMGLFMASFYVGRAFIAPVSGWWSDKFGPRPFLVLGNLLLAVALLSLSRLGTDATTAVLLSSMLLAGVGSAFFEPVAGSVIMGSVPRDRLGTASASIAMGRQSAFSVGVAVAGAVFATRQRVYLSHQTGAGIPEDVAGVSALVGGFNDTVLVGAMLAAVAIGLSFYTRTTRSADLEQAR